MVKVVVVILVLPWLFGAVDGGGGVMVVGAGSVGGGIIYSTRGIYQVLIQKQQYSLPGSVVSLLLAVMLVVAVLVVLVVVLTVVVEVACYARSVFC